MMERILEIYLAIVWILVPSFFWNRGFWRNDGLDCAVAILINGVLIVAVGFGGDFCTGINAAGLWFFVTGLVTLGFGAFRKTMPREKLIPLCLIMVMAGLLMLMVL